MDLSFVKEIPGISAVVYMGLGGMETGNALADVLTGVVNPCGKLTDTLSARYEDYPASASFADHNNTQLHPMYTEGIYVGYRYFDSFGVKPLYPFGYGLSYTDFELKTISASSDWEKTSLTVQVTNTGGFPGKEVVQLFISGKGNSVRRRAKELRGFEKIYLGAGEEKTVRFSLGYEELKVYSARGRYEIEDASVTVSLGVSTDLPLAVEINTEAEMKP
jgi:beta-glucosidase